jgi:7,8-dihydro-6-hydroxymethylpterin-pyrophosphokinase
MHIFLALGSNLGDRDMNLVQAKDLLMKHDVLVLGQSEVRETEPLGGLDQPKYLNQVIECQTELSPEELLKACKTVEQEMGREVDMPKIGNVQFGFGSGASSQVQKPEERWQSRIIDVDILFYGDQVVNLPYLTIPHPGMATRDFLIQGMRDLKADF